MVEESAHKKKCSATFFSNMCASVGIIVLLLLFLVMQKFERDNEHLIYRV